MKKDIILFTIFTLTLATACTVHTLAGNAIEQSRTETMERQSKYIDIQSQSKKLVFIGCSEG